MRDPHIHVEKTVTPGFGNAAMRDLIVRATGLAPSLPKTVGTGCGRRRPFAMTTLIPERVTCLPCREYAREAHRNAAETAELLLEWHERDPAGFGPEPVPVAEIAAQARADRAMAARYRDA